ncbi:TetR/AcrR family transcriptional regulator [Paenibacillus sp. MER 99-2]|uniref:TetR/AcrR family transcriptional regulator n=1 Tax=Paenibacillus sp. MER 99-2 TaxID=2939572 RepID=UPI0020403121|nr:TetR/AcrR family transcriptional regulator [Paenibacillus sp. MER 99-2]MCM3171411.1 TetR/AcrR family transcriptional regulator [Paenibacillus sp. MER 99-2]
MTEQKLLSCAKSEFLEKGFLGASMRSIAQKASMTTGAIYRYFPDKNALFEALVKPTADEISAYFEEISSYQLQLLEYNETVLEYESMQKGMLQIVDFIYDRFDIFDLLINGSTGSNKEHYIDYLMELDLSSTQAYIHKLSQLNILQHSPPAHLLSILVKQSYRQVLEIVVSRMNREEAFEYMQLLIPFLYAGWTSLLETQNNSNKAKEEKQ